MTLLQTAFGALAADWTTALGGLFLLTILFGVLLYFAYPDRALFTASQDARPDVPLVKEGTAPLVGNLPLFIEATNYFSERCVELAHKYGSAYRFTFGLPIPTFLTFNGKVSQDMVAVYDPKDVEHVLRDPYKYPKGHDAFVMQKPLLGHGIFSSDGDEWLVQRKVASSIFQVRHFRDFYTPVFQSDAVKVCRHLRAAHDMGAAIDLQQLLLVSTMDSFIRIAMGVELGGLDAKGFKDSRGRYALPPVAFSQAFDALNNVVFQRSFSPIWNIEEALTGKRTQIAAWKKTVDDFALRVINEKRAKMADKGARPEGGPEAKESKDLLDLFMATRNDDGSELNNEQLRDVLVNFLIAGRDTTAQTLCWVWYNLHSHPEAERKVRAELFSKLPPSASPSKNDPPVQLPGYEDLSRLKYSVALFNEVLRLHPNVPINSKEAATDDVLPTGIKIRKGDIIQFAPFVMGRLESIWGPDVLEMKPERWLNEQGDLIKVSPFKFPAFNAGPRACLGVNLATQEAQVIMAAVLTRFHLELCFEDEPEKWGLWDPVPEKRKGRYDNQLTLAFRGGVHFKVHLLEEKETE